MVSAQLLNLLRAHSTNSVVGRCLRAIEENEIKFSLQEQRERRRNIVLNNYGVADDVWFSRC